jgi:hypothetical protein
MKKGLLITIIILSGIASTSFAEEKGATCRLITGDVGEIVGRGQSRKDAQANAAEQCFDRRMSLYERARGRSPDQDQGLDFIDNCVNLSCS